MTPPQPVKLPHKSEEIRAAFEAIAVPELTAAEWQIPAELQTEIDAAVEKMRGELDAFLAGKPDEWKLYGNKTRTKAQCREALDRFLKGDKKAAPILFQCKVRFHAYNGLMSKVKRAKYDAASLHEKRVKFLGALKPYYAQLKEKVEAMAPGPGAGKDSRRASTPPFRPSDLANLREFTKESGYVYVKRRPQDMRALSRLNADATVREGMREFAAQMVAVSEMLQANLVVLFAAERGRGRREAAAERERGKKEAAAYRAEWLKGPEVAAYRAGYANVVVRHFARKGAFAGGAVEPFGSHGHPLARGPSLSWGRHGHGGTEAPVIIPAVPTAAQTRSGTAFVSAALPRPAAQNRGPVRPQSIGDLRSGRVLLRAVCVVVAMVHVRDPFAHVPVHVVEAPGIGLLVPHRVPPAARIARDPGVFR